LTGAMADHRLVMSPDELEQFARDLESGNGSAKAIAADLRAHAGRCLVVADELEPIARRINDSLGNIGQTVDYFARGEVGRDLRELIDEMRAGAVEILFIISGNPVYDAPADFEFAQLLAKIPRTIHFGLYADETAAACQWH